MLAKIRAALASPAGPQLLLPVVLIAWSVQRLVVLAEKLQADIELAAAELEQLEQRAAERAAELADPYPSAEDVAPLSFGAARETPEGPTVSVRFDTHSADATTEA